MYIFNINPHGLTIAQIINLALTLLPKDDLFSVPPPALLEFRNEIESTLLQLDNYAGETVQEKIKSAICTILLDETLLAKLTHSNVLSYLLLTSVGSEMEVRSPYGSISILDLLMEAIETGEEVIRDHWHYAYPKDEDIFAAQQTLFDEQRQYFSQIADWFQQAWHEDYVARQHLEKSSYPNEVLEATNFLTRGGRNRFDSLAAVLPVDNFIQGYQLTKARQVAQQFKAAGWLYWMSVRCKYAGKKSKHVTLEWHCNILPVQRNNVRTSRSHAQTLLHSPYFLLSMLLALPERDDLVVPSALQGLIDTVEFLLNKTVKTTVALSIHGREEQITMLLATLWSDVQFTSKLTIELIQYLFLANDEVCTQKLSIAGYPELSVLPFYDIMLKIFKVHDVTLSEQLMCPEQSGNGEGAWVYALPDVINSNLQHYFSVDNILSLPRLLLPSLVYHSSRGPMHLRHLLCLLQYHESYQDFYVICEDLWREVVRARWVDLKELSPDREEECFSIHQGVMDDFSISPDEYSNLIGGHIINVPGDGNCFFHAIAQGLKRATPFTNAGLNTNELLLSYTALRALAVRYTKENVDRFLPFFPVNSGDEVMDKVDEYLRHMQRDGTPAEGAIIEALALALEVCFCIQNITIYNRKNTPHIDRLHKIYDDESGQRPVLTLLRLERRWSPNDSAPMSEPHYMLWVPPFPLDSKPVTAVTSVAISLDSVATSDHIDQSHKIDDESDLRPMSSSLTLMKEWSLSLIGEPYYPPQDPLFPIDSKPDMEATPIVVSSASVEDSMPILDMSGWWARFKTGLKESYVVCEYFCKRVLRTSLPAFFVFPKVKRSDLVREQDITNVLKDENCSFHAIAQGFQSTTLFTNTGLNADLSSDSKSVMVATSAPVPPASVAHVPLLTEIMPQRVSIKTELKDSQSHHEDDIDEIERLIQHMHRK